MNSKVRVFAPATIANMGCGFDVIGFSLGDVGDVIEMEREDGDGIKIVNSSSVPLPERPEDNVVTPVIRKFLEMTGNRAAVTVRFIDKIPPGSGIGSSASSCAAAARGMNALFGNPLSEEDLVRCAMEGECLASGSYHADNAAPAVMGGIILIRGYDPLDLAKIPVPDDFYCAVFHPDLVVSTKEARAVLPKSIPVHDAICQWGNVGGLVAGLYRGDMQLVGRAMRDCFAEPYRKCFIPGFDYLREKVLAAGSLAMNIAGSGPSVFSLADNMDTAAKTVKIMREHFGDLGFRGESYVVKASDTGAKVLGEA